MDIIAKAPDMPQSTYEATLKLHQKWDMNVPIAMTLATYAQTPQNAAVFVSLDVSVSISYPYEDLPLLPCFMLTHYLF
jgi:hypothetical protein